jgi:hypothetical protein
MTDVAENGYFASGERGQVIRLADYLNRRPAPEGDGPPRSPIAARRPVEPTSVEVVGRHARRAASGSVQT